MAVNVNFSTANCNWVSRQGNQAPSPTDSVSGEERAGGRGNGGGDKEGGEGECIDAH